MASRARWVMKYEKGLVDILHENNVSQYRTQSGWRSEGWRKIVKDFNERYPEAGFSKMQIQEHETQLKKDYKLIKLVLRRDGVSWDQSASMIKTTDEIWDDIIQDMPKARKYQRASFPLLDSLELLFDGPVPEGGHNLASSIPKHVFENFDEGGNNISALPGMSGRPCGTVNASIDDGWNNISLLQRTALGPQGIDDHDLLQNHTEEILERPRRGADPRPQRADEQVQSSSCVEPQKDRCKKRKVPDIQQTMESYLDFRMKQARLKEQRMKDQTTRDNEQFSISKCIKALHNMPNLSDEVKVFASDVFKDAENREIFLSYELRLRTLWLQREVDRLRTQIRN
uniref:Myb/SANT-like domain-containing protein n=1 Tax=Arundo donax TaxID=35708 RepID=A0A0A9FNF4_ARUDO